MDKKTYLKQYYQKNRELLREKQREYYILNKEGIKANSREYYATNTKACLKRVKSRAELKAPTLKAYGSEYKRSNAAKINSINAKRRAAKLHAAPAWLSKEQKRAIAAEYELAKELQWLSIEELQVDHIIPLQGENISGLHVPWNLQILPASMNNSKSNKVEGIK